MKHDKRENMKQNNDEKIKIIKVNQKTNNEKNNEKTNFKNKTNILNNE